VHCTLVMLTIALTALAPLCATSPRIGLATTFDCTRAGTT
jgi:hypothetical protein